MTVESRRIPGGWLARVSPLPKLAWLAAIVFVVLLTFDPLVLAVLGLAAWLVAVSAGVATRVLRTLALLAPIAASILVLQSIAPVACGSATCEPVLQAGPLRIYAEGTARALVLIERLVVLEVVSVVLLSTTEPADLFAALRAMHIPYEVALMAMLALWLIPVLQRELREVLDAQRGRGLRARGITALGPLLVPVAAGTFDRMTVLVLALEARGLGAGHRTSWRRVELDRTGWLAIVTAWVAGVAGAWLAVTAWRASGSTMLVVPGSVAVTLVAGGAAVFVGSVMAARRALTRA